MESPCHVHMMDSHGGSRPRLPELQLAARRRTYRRSQTVSALPVVRGDSEFRGRTTKNSIQTQVKATSDLSPRGKRSTDVLDGFRKTWSFRSTSPRQRVVLQTLGHPVVGEKVREKVPICRTPSSPSILLSRVREKIKEKVIETSVEWPSMAVIVQEKRQKAVSAFEAQLSQVHGVLLADHDDPGLEQHCTSKLVVKKVLTQSRSTSGEITSVRERSRLELRRRSISMDTFERLSRTVSEGPSSLKTERGGGVVCTTDDLKSIMNSYREDLNRQNPPNVLHRLEIAPRKSSSLRENREKAVVSGGLNLDKSHIFPEAEKISNPIPSIDSGIRINCETINESTSNAFSTNSLQRLESTRSHTTLFRSSSANNSSSKARSLALSSNRKGFFFRRCASVCNTPTVERTSPAQLLHVQRLEEASVPCLRSSSNIKDHATTCLIAGRNRYPSICPSSPRKSKAGAEPIESGLVYLSSDFDPEIIGQAIQVHLETMMRSRTSADEVGELRN